MFESDYGGGGGGDVYDYDNDDPLPCSGACMVFASLTTVKSLENTVQLAKTSWRKWLYNCNFINYISGLFVNVHDPPSARNKLCCLL